MTYDGFHFYEADICLAALSAGWKVAVGDILCEHGSEGPIPDSWHNSKRKFLTKWKSKGVSFPVTVDSFKTK